MSRYHYEKGRADQRRVDFWTDLVIGVIVFAVSGFAHHKGWMP